MRTEVSWRYVVLGLGFLALGGVRAAQGAPVWAVVFVLAGAANAWLAFRGDREDGEPTAPAVGGADPRDVERELGRCLTAQRQWQVLGLGGALLAAGLLLIEPPLAVLGGAAALFAVFRARRVRRYAATLRRMSSAPVQRDAYRPVHERTHHGELRRVGGQAGAAVRGADSRRSFGLPRAPGSPRRAA